MADRDFCVQTYINEDFPHLYKAKTGLMRRYMSEQDAEDVVMAALVTAVEEKDKYDKRRGKVNAWFNKILFRTKYKFQQENGKYIPLNENALLDKDTKDYYMIVEDECLSTKNPVHRNIILAFYCQGYTAKEVAGHLNVSVSNVNTVCNRFKKRLKEKYGVEV